jgi:DNA polymerase-3 subunit alpha
MSGLYDFYNVANKNGIKPIMGMEGYLAKGDRVDRSDTPENRRPYHLLLIAKNNVGYRNLTQISSEAMLGGYYYRPRADKALLEAHRDGLIVTSGCLAAEIPSLYMSGNEAGARKAIDWYRNVFDNDFYLEVQYRKNSTDQLALNKWLLQVSDELNIPAIVTTDAHYVRQEDASWHDTLLCIQTRANKAATNRMRFDEDTYYIAPADVIAQAFSGRLDVLSNTLLIADQCDVQFDKPQNRLPEFDIPEGYTTETYLKHLAERGLAQRYEAITDEVRQRFDYELYVINNMGFNNYFLIVWDICEYARQQGIWWNVRGSGAGSLIAYCLGITSVDPLKYGLYFERFLNPDRVSMPDIDMDFQDDRRSELVNYVVHKYGSERVAAIITFGTLAPRAAIRDVGRVLDVDSDLIESLVHEIPEIKPLDFSLKQHISDNETLNGLYGTDNIARQVLDEAQNIEGLARQSGTHAAGIVIADKPLTEYIPLARISGKSSDTDLKAVTQFPMEPVEKLGLLKIDFLGLSTLTIMRRACDIIRERHGEHWSIDNIPYDHGDDIELNAMLDAAFKLIATGRTAGVFQLEGDGMTAMLKKMQPTEFKHIAAAVALFRPGPMQFIDHYINRMHGTEEIEYIHPGLEPILGFTYGVIVYQESIMRIAVDLFGFTLSEADKIRKDVAKITGNLNQWYEKFLEKGKDKGISVETIDEIWGEIKDFARYGFNLSHAVDYAKISVQTAFLKAHYPAEYMCSVLQTYNGNNKRMPTFIDECRKMGIPLLPPDINTSGDTFVIEDVPGKETAIRFGLANVKGVGGKAAEKILEARGTTPFEDIGDIVARLSSVNKKAIENLIKVGAFSKFGSRSDLLASVDNFKVKKRASKKVEADQLSLFDSGDYMPEDNRVNLKDLIDPAKIIEYDERQLLDWERELIGFYISARPIDKYRPFFRKNPTTEIADIYDPEIAPRKVLIGGEISDIRPITTKHGDQMAFVVIEDWHDSGLTVNVVAFPRMFKECYRMLKVGAPVMIMGKVDYSRNQPSVIMEVIDPVEGSE